MNYLKELLHKDKEYQIIVWNSINYNYLRLIHKYHGSYPFYYDNFLKNYCNIDLDHISYKIKLNKNDMQPISIYSYNNIQFRIINSNLYILENILSLMPNILSNINNILGLELPNINKIINIYYHTFDDECKGSYVPEESALYFSIDNIKMMYGDFIECTFSYIYT